jgi:hypothetical protein
MPKIEKSLNKILIGAILGTTILWVAGASMTPKWKSLIWKMKDFIKWWINELKKSTDAKLKKKDETEKAAE